ncbi:hypothetical protein D3C76_1700220 [compost metagenome]
MAIEVHMVEAALGVLDVVLGQARIDACHFVDPLAVDTRDAVAQLARIDFGRLGKRQR